MRGALVLGLLLAGCGTDEPDHEPPAIVRAEPASGQTGVALDTSIRLWFDEPVDNQKVSWADQLHLVWPDGSALFGSASYDLAARSATLVLLSPLLPGATYQVALEPRICDLCANCTTGPLRWSFTTGQ